jgi:hypothetical protein
MHDLYTDFRSLNSRTIASVTDGACYPTDTTRTQYAKCRLYSPPEDEQVMPEICRDT